VKSQDPSSAPPLLAATSLLLLNENRESDRNKKRVVNDLSSRIKHFRENKLKQSMKSSISDFGKLTFYFLFVTINFGSKVNYT